MGNLGGIDAKKLREALLADIKAAKEDTAPEAEEAGVQVGESFVGGIEQGFEGAASRITASSLKINKAFKDLAKKITSQNITLSGLNIDFSDIDINEADFQKKVNESFEKFKIDNAIEFDSAAIEKQFKDMLGLYTKYALKLSKLQEQRPRLTASASIKANAQAQLAVADGLREIQKILDQTSGMSIELPHIYIDDVGELRNTVQLIEQIEKGEKKVGKQRDTNVERVKQENKELRERNKIYEEKFGPIEEGELSPAKKSSRSKPKAETSAITGTSDNEMKSFGVQLKELQKEFGDPSGWLNQYTLLMEQIRQGALTAEEAVAKLREEITAQPVAKHFDLLNLKAKTLRPELENIKQIVKEAVDNEKTGLLSVFSDDDMGASAYLTHKDGSYAHILDGVIYEVDAFGNKLETELSKITKTRLNKLLSNIVYGSYSDGYQRFDTQTGNLEPYEPSFESGIYESGRRYMEDYDQMVGVLHGDREALRLEEKMSDEEKLSRQQRILQYEELINDPTRIDEYYNKLFELQEKFKIEQGRLEEINANISGAFDNTDGSDDDEIAIRKRIIAMEMERKKILESIAVLYKQCEEIPLPDVEIEEMKKHNPMYRFGRDRTIDEDPHSADENISFHEREIRNAEERVRLAKEQEEAEKRALELSKQRAEEEAKIATEKANGAEIENNKEKIKSYEELTAAVREYLDLKSQLKHEFNYSGMRRDAFIMMDRYENIDTDEGIREQMMKDFNALWSEREKVKKSIKTGSTYIASDGQEYLGSEREIERLTTEINGLSAAYIYLGGSVDDFSSRAKKISTATSWNLFKQAEEQDLTNNKAAEEFNKPIEEQMGAIEAALVKQQLNPDSIAVWSALEVDGGTFENRLHSIAKALGIEIPRAAGQAEEAIENLESAAYETDSGQMSMFPDVEEEVDAKNKLAEANDKVAESQKKIKETEQGTQLTIDDIVPTDGEDAAPKIEAEVKALDEVGESAEKAANKKDRFANANKKVADSTAPSIDGLQKEADEIESVGESVSKTNKIISEEAKHAAESMSFSTDNYEKLYEEMEAFAAQRRDNEGFDQSKVSVKTDVFDKPIGATISYYNKATNESIVETFKMAEDGTDRLILKTRQVTKGIADFDKANLRAIKNQNNLMSQKNKTLGTLSGALDPNANRTLAGTQYEEEAKNKIQAIRNEVAKLDHETNGVLSEEDFIAIKRRIDELTQEARDFINESKNAEYAPTQLESHAVSSGNQYRADQLKAQVNEWERAGVYVGDLKAKADELSRSVTKITKHEDLKKYLEGMKEARALAKLATQDKKAEEDRQKALNKEYEEYIALIEKRDAIEAKMIGLNPEKNRDELAALQADYDAVDNEWNSKYGDFLSRKDVQEHFSIDELAYADDAARRKMAVKEGQISDKKRLEEEAAAQTKVNEAYREYIRLIQERGRKQAELTGLDPEKNKEQINAITARIDEIDTGLNETYGDLLSNKIAQATLTLEDFMKYYDKWQQKITEKEAQAADKARNKEEKPYRDYGKTTANSAARKRDTLQGEVDALGVTNPKILAKIDAYNAKVKEVVDLRDRFAKDPEAAKDQALVKQFQQAAAEAERTRKSIKSVIDEEQKMAQMSMEQGFDPRELSTDQMANLQNEMIAHAKATAQGRVEIQGWNDDHTKMYYTVTDAKGAVDEMTMAVGAGTNNMYQYRTATKETGTLMSQIFKGIKVKAKELVSYVIGGAGVYKVVEMLRQGIQYVKEIDAALTELKKVTNETAETYNEFVETAAKAADKLGSTLQEVISSTADFARLGSILAQTNIRPII